MCDRLLARPVTGSPAGSEFLYIFYIFYIFCKRSVIIGPRVRSYSYAGESSDHVAASPSRGGDQRFTPLRLNLAETRLCSEDFLNLYAITASN
jgi:hypothetical protein